MIHHEITRFHLLVLSQSSYICSVIQCRIELEKARLLVLEAADQLDRLGNKKARGIIAMAKVIVVSNMKFQIQSLFIVILFMIIFVNELSLKWSGGMWGR